MADIRDKIAKLLALAESANENEARSALLKARELMAEHKLRPEECAKAEKMKVVKELVGVSCTKMTDAWAVELSATIAENHCCKAYRRRAYNSKTVSIGLVGLEDDFAVCKQIFLYACDCIRARCNEIRSEHRKQGWSGNYIREMCNAYGWGFCAGLKSAYKEQGEERQEWGLVLVVPQAVTDSMQDMNKGKTFALPAKDSWLQEFRAEGYDDGLKFDPSRRLEGDRQSDKALTTPPEKTMEEKILEALKGAESFEGFFFEVDGKRFFVSRNRAPRNSFSCGFTGWSGALYGFPEGTQPSAEAVADQICQMLRREEALGRMPHLI